MINKNYMLRFTVRQNIKYLRITAGMSQRDLATKANISIATLGQIERGSTSPTLKTVDKLASALDVSSYVLLRTPSQEQPAKIDTSEILEHMQQLESVINILLEAIPSISCCGIEKKIESEQYNACTST